MATAPCSLERVSIRISVTRENDWGIISQQVKEIPWREYESYRYGSLDHIVDKMEIEIWKENAKG